MGALLCLCSHVDVDLYPYYLYMTDTIIGINNQLEAGFEDTARQAFMNSEMLIRSFLSSLSFQHLGSMIYLSPDVLLHIVCRLQPSTKKLCSTFMTHEQMADLMRGFIRVLCDGDVSGAFNEDRRVNHIVLNVIYLSSQSSCGISFYELRANLIIPT